MKKDKKIRILVWADSPDCATGFGTVTRGVFTELGKTGKYDIDIIGINEAGGWKDPDKFPNMRIYPALPGASNERDFHGRKLFVETVFGKNKEIRPGWDIIFTLNDPFVLDLKVHGGYGTLQMLVKAQLSYILQAPADFWFKIVSYFPVDSKLRSNWVRDTISLADSTVAYTHYGKAEMLKANNELGNESIKGLEDRISIIYHGYDNEKYFPLPKKEVKEFKDKYFQKLVGDDTFIVGVVGRNQMRKDIPRAMKMFAEFKKRRPDSFLYIHAQGNDVWGNLEEYGSRFGLKLGEDFAIPAGFDPRFGVKPETLNKVYNACDVLLSSNLGEGFGLTYLEAMGAGTLNLAPFHTTTPELFDLKNTDINEKARGVAYKSGSNKTEWVFLGPQDNMTERPIGNVEDAVEKLIWIYDNPEKAEKIASNGNLWAQNYTWKRIAKDWDSLFQKTYKDLEEDRENEEAIRKDTSDKLGIEEGNE